MQKHRSITVERLDKFMENGQFGDVNIQATLWELRDSGAVSLSVYSVPELRRIPFEEAVAATYVPAKVGDKFGPTWSTHWFKLSITVPSAMTGKKIVLLFDPSCEACIWSTSGEPLQGITGDFNGDRHVDFPLTKNAKPKERFDFFVEVACNGMFGAGAGNYRYIPCFLDSASIATRYFTLATAEIAVPNETAHSLFWDLEVLIGMIKQLPATDQANSDALYTANKIVNTIRTDIPQSIHDAKAVAEEFFKSHKGNQDALHTITAVGNCHIDTAWLWPYGETKRKVARSWATQCTLIEEYPEYVFAASPSVSDQSLSLSPSFSKILCKQQAQQFEWVEKLYPKLFARILKHHKTGNFVPIGATWVEMDCNIPSGEAFCRQFLYGQRYYQQKFGQRSRVFWLPDTFGYSAQLPQIVREAGVDYFFTQKLSWNNINKFPHTTFNWVGLDGTPVLTHFCPADTYTAGATTRDVTYSVTNNKDKEYSNQSLLLYGNGDGGGGPLIHMIERLTRMKSVKGLPATVKFGDPTVFYDSLKSTSRDLVTWKGELYFELHRGTYTSQALVKKYNRSTELLLREIEILAAWNLAAGAAYSFPKDEMDRLWKLVLLQVHMPKNSPYLFASEMVYKIDIDRRLFFGQSQYYEDITLSGLQIKAQALESLIAAQKKTAVGTSSILVFNSTSWDREPGVVTIDAARAAGKAHQLSSDKTKALVMSMSSQ
eukprot:jgi/Hompol1/5018/HPOL_004093-RA